MGLQHQTVPMAGLQNWNLPDAFQDRAANNLLLTASFGVLIPKKMLGYFGASHRLNLHPSLLPMLAGAAPIQWAIARQLEKTGVTTQTLGEKLDSGDIYAQEETVCGTREGKGKIEMH
jgi:methionyl-tRNA formyltransferase